MTAFFINPTILSDAIRISLSKNPEIPARLNEHVHTQHSAYAPRFFKPYKFEAMLAEMKQFLQKDGFILLIAWWEEEPVGYALGWPNIRLETAFNNEDRIFLLDQMAVHPEHRSKGIGARLMNAMEENALLNGFPKLELSVWLQNDRAVQFYLDAGFEPVTQLMRKSLLDFRPGFSTDEWREPHIDGNDRKLKFTVKDDINTGVEYDDEPFTGTVMLGKDKIEYFDGSYLGKTEHYGKHEVLSEIGEKVSDEEYWLAHFHPNGYLKTFSRNGKTWQFTKDGALKV